MGRPCKNIRPRWGDGNVRARKDGRAHEPTVASGEKRVVFVSTFMSTFKNDRENTQANLSQKQLLHLLMQVCSDVVMRSGVHHAVFSNFKHTGGRNTGGGGGGGSGQQQQQQQQQTSPWTASGSDCKGPVGLVRVPKRQPEPAAAAAAGGGSRGAVARRTGDDGGGGFVVPPWAHSESWRWVHGPHASIDHRDHVRTCLYLLLCSSQKVLVN